MAPAVLQLMEIEPPAELAAALSADFLDRLGIATPPPIQIAALEQWGGYCHEEDATERGEVIVSDWRVPRPEWLTLERIQEVYTHETAHRLIGQTCQSAKAHGIEFFTLLIFLLWRAGGKKGGCPWFIFWRAYDFQDCMESRGIPGVPSSGESIDWATETALELAGLDLTAEAAASEICRRAKSWGEWKAKEPKRREAAREKQEAIQTAFATAHDKIFWWRVYFFASSFLAAAFLILAISMR